MADFYDKNQDKTKEALGKLGKMSTALMSNPNIDTEQPKHLPKTAYHNCQAAAQMTG
ncbi:MAG: hypothetical protein Q4A69_05560 [Moraxella sp.]|nr:hypothetical protein [Moraxella sp.]